MRLESTARRMVYSALSTSGVIPPKLKKGQTNTITSRYERTAKQLGISVTTLKKVQSGGSVKKATYDAILNGFLQKSPRSLTFPQHVHFVNHRSDSFSRLDTILDRTLNYKSQPAIKHVKSRTLKSGKIKKTTRIVKYTAATIKRDEMAKYFLKTKKSPKSRATRQLDYALAKLNPKVNIKTAKKRMRRDHAEFQEMRQYDEFDSEEMTDQDIENAILDFFDSDALYGGGRE